MSHQRKQSMIAIMKVQRMNQAHQQTQAKLQEVTEKHKAAHSESQQHKKRASEAEKRAKELEKAKQEAEEELHALKLKFDGDYAFKYNAEKKKAATNKRVAKNSRNKRMKELRDVERSKAK